MRKQPEEIWCENGVYYEYEHDGGIKYVRADHIEQLVATNEAQAAEIERLRGDLAKAVNALERVSNSQPRPKRNGDYDKSDVSALQRIARTTLAALTGA